MISNNDCETVLRLQQLIAEEEMLWLKQFDSLTDTEAEVLILAKKMGQITNKDIRENVGLDTLQASSILRKFCKNNYLLQHGKSSNSYYLLNSCYTDNCDSLAGNDQSLAGASTGLNEPSYPNNEPSYPNNEPSYPNNEVEISDNTHLISIATPARLKKRLPNDELRAIILQLCQHDFLSLIKVSDLIARTTQTTQNHLTALVKEAKLAKKYPQDTHPSQAYRTTDKGLAYLQTLDDNPQQNLLI